MPKGSDLLVAALENEGVDRIFGVPGEENLDVVESLRNSSIKLILTRHEQGAAFMAATYGRLTGRPGVCITTLGPGALNLTTAAAYALLGAMPMVMLTGQKGIMSSRQARFQIVDVVTAFKPLTKLSRQIVSTSSIPTLVRDAFRIAMEERPGPVLLELPEDVAGEEADDIAMVQQHPIEIPVAHRARPCRRVDPQSQAAVDHARRCRIASAQHGRNRRVRAPHQNSLFHDPDGQGNRSRRQQSIHGHSRAQRARLCARGG
jgi:acetolactate synthase-1/2/3 large subunit